MINKILLILFLLPLSCFGQEDEELVMQRNKALKGFHAGFFAGVYFPSHYNANMYDGYGFDSLGNKNEFDNSILYRKLVFELGGYYGQDDMIAEALGVDHGDWEFTRADMPVELTYSSAFQYGIQTRTGFSGRDAIIANLNLVKLRANGLFTIAMKTVNSSGAQDPGFKNIQTFGISGQEQRLLGQLGYQRLLGENQSFCFFAEGGATIAYTKFERSEAQIKSLTIDLTYNYTNAVLYGKKPKALYGTGFGAFAGFGVNILAGNKLTMQIVYDASLDKIKVGSDPAHKLHHSAGFRAFWKIA